MITTQLGSLWLTVKVLYKMIKFTLLTTKLSKKIHNLESMYFVDLQPQLHQVSQSGQVSQLAVKLVLYVKCTLLKSYNDHATIVKSFSINENSCTKSKLM